MEGSNPVCLLVDSCVCFFPKYGPEAEKTHVHIHGWFPAADYADYALFFLSEDFSVLYAWIMDDEPSFTPLAPLLPVPNVASTDWF